MNVLIVLNLGEFGMESSIWGWEQTNLRSEIRAGKLSSSRNLAVQVLMYSVDKQIKKSPGPKMFSSHLANGGQGRNVEYSSFLDTCFEVHGEAQAQLCKKWDKMKGRRNSAEHAQTIGELDSLVKATVRELNRHSKMGDQ